MNARTLLPAVAGIALMACGGSETTSPVLPTAPVAPAGPVSFPSVEITPQEVTLAPGMRQSLFLALKGLDGDGVRRAVWTSSDSTVVQVATVIVNGAASTAVPSAIAYGARAGSATVTAWIGGRSATVAITVTDPPTVRN